MNKESTLKKKHAFIILTGPSGVGKSTLVRALLTDYGPKVLGTTVSYTTRPQRGKEKDGKSYYFLSKKKFLSLREKDFFVEWAYVYGNYYGTAKEELEKHWKKKRAVIKDFDLKGAYALKKIYPHALVLFIAPPSLSVLRQRLIKRQENIAQDIKIRLQQAEEELKQASYFDREIKNHDLKQTTETIKQVVKIYLNLSSKTKSGP